MGLIIFLPLSSFLILFICSKFLARIRSLELALALNFWSLSLTLIYFVEIHTNITAVYIFGESWVITWSSSMIDLQ